MNRRVNLFKLATIWGPTKVILMKIVNFISLAWKWLRNLLKMTHWKVNFHKTLSRVLSQLSYHWWNPVTALSSQMTCLNKHRPFCIHLIFICTQNSLVYSETFKIEVQPFKHQTNPVFWLCLAQTCAKDLYESLQKNAYY